MTRRTIKEKGKAPLHLLLMRCLDDVAAVLDHGNRKPGRGPFNWRKDKVRESDQAGAVMRHTRARATGEKLDPGSKRSHWAHVAARALIAMDAEDYGNLIPAQPKRRR